MHFRVQVVYSGAGEGKGTRNRETPAMASNGSYFQSTVLGRFHWLTPIGLRVAQTELRISICNQSVFGTDRCSRTSSLLRTQHYSYTRLSCVFFISTIFARSQTTPECCRMTLRLMRTHA